MEEAQWEGDSLKRSASSDFLYRFVIKKHESKSLDAKGGALCFALDGDWGTGKTFFVGHWSLDLERFSHPVIKFDAWKNDLSEDPLVGFMAQLRKSLQPYIAHLPVEKKVRDAANRRVAKIVKQAGKAVVPALGMLLKGVANKYSDGAMKEITDLFAATEGSGVDTASNEESADSEKTKQPAMSKAALDKFFEVAMQSHSDRQEAIQSLKETIEDLLDYLSKNTQVALPMFVFIDELDRCRPDYAIRLLEGLKHLFDAKGVCFVVSTNLKQLSESVRSVYGAGFDGYIYLKRFFAFEYVLPEPDNESYATSLFEQSIFRDYRIQYSTGLPDKTHNVPAGVNDSFAVVATAFRMDLRSQQQVFRHSEAAAAGLPDSLMVHVFYLFFLSSLLHYSRPTFEKLATEGKGLKIGDHRALYQSKEAHFSDCQIQFRRLDRKTGQRSSEFVTASEVFHQYDQLARTKRIEVFRKEQLRHDDPEYPQTLNASVMGNINQVPNPSEDTSIANYYNLVRSAGQIS